MQRQLAKEGLQLDLESVFEMTAPVLEVVIRGSLIYLGVVILVRVVGQRETGSLSIPDLIVVVLISEAVSNGFAANDDSLTTGFILVLTILAWSVVLDALAYRFPWFRKIMKPAKRPLIQDGELNKRLMRRELLTRAEVDAQLRLQGIEDVADVERAYLEPSGQISAFSKK